MRLLKQLHFVLFALCFALQSFAGTTFKATTTLTAETSNNTSTAGSFTAQTNGNLGPSNISKAPTRSLLYPGSTAKIYAHFMPWFGFGDHMNVGYVSSDTLEIQKQVNDMISRGLDGAVIDWYGRGESSKHFASYELASQGFMHESELHTGFNFAIMHDAGALKACATTVGCDVTQTLIDDLNYAIITYAGSPAYLNYGGHPVLYFFGHEAYTIDWSRVRAGVAGNPMFIFRNGSGFTAAQSNGAFSWVAPETVSSTNLMALNYLDNFYKTATGSFPTTYSTGSGYKGFNDTLALWGTNRIIDQQCGQTWLTSVAEEGKYYSATRQMLGIQIVTWNDYEEGSEIETGIDNCVTATASVTGTVVSWSITGQMNTVDHFTIFASQDGENLMWLADAPTTATSLDIAQFSLNSGNYIIYVKAVGKPSLTNKMSAGVQLTVPNLPPAAVLSVTPASGTGPLTVSASTAGSSDPDGTIASTTVDFGDGSAAVSATSASHVYNTAGTYTVTATVTDNLGATASKSAAVVVSAAVNQSPVAALSVTPSSGVAPLNITASTAGSADPDGTIASTTINFGDGSAAVSAASASHIYNTAGTYTVTATVTDNLGASSTKAATIVVSAPNKPPVAAISATPTSAYGPASVSVSAAGSSDPDGTIASTVINFGDGTTMNAVSGTHTYSAAGVYSITATVTDNSGASSSASTSVTVKAPEVIVSSPGSGTSVTSLVHVVAIGFSGYPVTAMQIYLDSTLVYNISSASLDTTVKIPPGTHALLVKGWDNFGRNFSKSLSVSVVNQPPVAALSLSTASTLVGGSITASTSGSSDPDGTIASSVINFGDGMSPVSATSATHQYKTAGTYTITATVTDNLGASSSTSKTVTVKAPFVTIASPTFTSTTDSSVLASGTASSGYPVIATQVYLDGVKKYQSSTSTASVTLSVSAGTHQIVIQGWDSSGATFKSWVTVTRQ
ncbi:MAG TPA: PKD domain-containing protein [Candidatus Angelobacter sp.]|nr:PKD domain-containing protein [Candidatus Angelobacter sp.]